MNFFLKKNFFLKNKNNIKIFQRNKIYNSLDFQQRKKNICEKNGFIIDMDGVLYHAEHLLPGIKEFIEWLQNNNKRFLFLTNSSDITREQLTKKIERLTGINIPPSYFFTSALATASFLDSQTPRGTAYVVGQPALVSALNSVGYSITDDNPDYVVVGETKDYNFHMIERSVHHIRNGAKLIGTNKDLFDRVGTEFVPATGTLIAPIEIMTGTKAYFVGKPNPLIISHAMKTLKTRHKDTVIIGDRMDTDIQCGIELGIDTVLVLTGVTTLQDLKQYAFKPTIILDGIKDLLLE